MDSQEKDDSQRDRYSKGRTTDPRDFVRPPSRLQEEQDEVTQGMEEIYQRYMECNRGAFGTQFMRHSYLYDGYTGDSTGKGNPRTQEGGPFTDSCYWLPGSKSQQKQSFQHLRRSVELEEAQPKGLPEVLGGTPDVTSWAPGTQDCHTMKDHSTRSHGIPSYTSRLGEHNTRPQVSPEEMQRVNEKLYAEKLRRSEQSGKTCKPPQPMRKPPSDDGGGGMGGIGGTGGTSLLQTLDPFNW